MNRPPGNWPFDWKRCRRTVADFAPPPQPAIVGPGRGRPLEDVMGAALEARRKLARPESAERAT